MKLIWTEEELPQGSDAWREFRSRGLGGSDIAPLMHADYNGHSPEMLWLRMKGFTPPKDFKEHMARGNRLEPLARALYAERYGVGVRQLCAVHPANDWMRTSLDGLTDDNSVILEIKCPKSERNHLKQTAGGRVPGYRYPQMQHQLMVMMAHFESVSHVDYVSAWFDEEEVEDTAETIIRRVEMRRIRVRPDLDYIRELERRERVFMWHLENSVRPEPTLFLDSDDDTVIPATPLELPTNEPEEDAEWLTEWTADLSGVLVGTK